MKRSGRTKGGRGNLEIDNQVILRLQQEAKPCSRKMIMDSIGIPRNSATIVQNPLNRLVKEKTVRKVPSSGRGYYELAPGENVRAMTRNDLKREMLIAKYFLDNDIDVPGDTKKGTFGIQLVGAPSVPDVYAPYYEQLASVARDLARLKASLVQDAIKSLCDELKSAAKENQKLAEWIDVEMAVLDLVVVRNGGSNARARPSEKKAKASRPNPWARSWFNLAREHIGGKLQVAAENRFLEALLSNRRIQVSGDIVNEMTQELPIAATKGEELKVIVALDKWLRRRMRRKESNMTLNTLLKHGARKKTAMFARELTLNHLRYSGILVLCEVPYAQALHSTD
jgi:hypothetical protein